MTVGGRHVRNAVVVLSDQNGGTRTAVTGSFEVGQTFLISVSSKRYSFEPRVLVVTDELTDVVFIGEEK